jgi:hypothetical protein
LTPLEHILALVAMSFLRAVIGVVPAMLLAIPFYDFSIFTLGVPLLAFFFNLLFMGCALGLLVTAMILRYGLAAENMAWFLVFFLAPFLRLLSRDGPAGLGAGTRLQPALDPCLRRHAGRALSRHLPVGSLLRGGGAQSAALPHRHRRLSLQLCTGTQAGAAAAGG